MTLREKVRATANQITGFLKKSQRGDRGVENCSCLGSLSWLFPWPLAIAIGYFALHMVTSTRYGYFRDALYYLACSEHLDWGYVDHPPLIVLIAWVTRHTLGTSLPALIFWPAMAGVGRILLVAALARALGAQSFGTTFAAFVTSFAPVWVAIDHQFAMNALEPLFWIGCALVLVRIVQTENPKLWMAFGMLAGLGLENKYSMAVFAFALLAGILLTPERKILITPWLFAGGAIALLIFLPNLWWNINHHWPFLELMHNIRVTGKDVVLSPSEFLAQQVRIIGPTALPVWFGGLLMYLFSRELHPYRALGYAFVITIAFFMLAHGKNYYSAPAYGVVFAGGAVAIERLFSSDWMVTRPLLRRVTKRLLVFWLILGTLPALPVVLPVLPVDSYLSYQKLLRIRVPNSETAQALAVLPPNYADEFGWQEMVEAVARVYDALPPEERAKTAILTDNYGEAAAIDFFGPRYGLPKAICPHQSYWLWGPRDYTGETVIRVGAPIDDVTKWYDQIEVAATLENPYAMPYETRPILLCHGRHGSLIKDWPWLKRWR
jgi:hypothetical protein